MRAAATFGFGRIHGLGMLAWHRSEYTGKMLGNPSVSETLTSYMLSLRRRKVCPLQGLSYTMTELFFSRHSSEKLLPVLEL